MKGGGGNEKLYGGERGDVLRGGTGADLLSGRKGYDTLFGGNGIDDLKGGNGSDVFVFNASSGKDTISDFSDDDIIQITSGATSFSDMALTDTGTGVLVEFGAVDILLTGLQLSEIGAGDFDFV